MHCPNCKSDQVKTSKLKVVVVEMTAYVCESCGHRWMPGSTVISEGEAHRRYNDPPPNVVPFPRDEDR